jgi:hypothetical protein
MNQRHKGTCEQSAKKKKNPVKRGQVVFSSISMCSLRTCNVLILQNSGEPEVTLLVRKMIFNKTKEQL